MEGKKVFNFRLFIACLIGAVVAFFVGNAVLTFLRNDLDPILLVGIYFAIFMLCISVAALICEMIEPRMQGYDWPREDLLKSWGMMLVTVAIFFGLGCLFQFIYGLAPVRTSLQQADDYIIVIDNSGSTYVSDPSEERFLATNEFLGNLTSEHRAAVIVFSDDPELLSPLTPVDDRFRAQMASDLSPFESNGGTDIQSALLLALDTLDDTQRNAMVILLSDGESYVDRDLVISRFNDKNTVLNSVGYAYNGFFGTSLLVRLSSMTGGMYYSLNDINQLAGTLDSILHQQSVERMLLDYRYGQDRDAALFMILRVLFIAILGAAVSLCFGLIFNNRFFFNQLLYSKIATGVLAGLVLEFGLYFFFPGFLTKIAMTLLLGVVITFYKPLVFGAHSAGDGGNGSEAADSSGINNKIVRNTEEHVLGDIRKG